MGAKRHSEIDIASFFAISILVLPVAFSQDAGAAALEEIVVTATKRDEPLMVAPLSIAVLTPKIPADAPSRDIFDVAAMEPTLDAWKSTGALSTSLFIRRIGNLGSIPNFEPAVGVFIDGAFRSRTGAALGDLFDLQQVEIARGPQSTLHGKNTTAGLVSITTNPPDTKLDLRGKVTVGVVDARDAANLVRLEGIVNLPLSVRTAMRAGGVIYEHDTTLRNIFNGENGQDAQRYTARGQLRYEDDTINARLIANRTHIDAARSGDLVLFEGNAIQNINAGFGVPCPDRDIDDRVFCRNDASVFDLTSSDITLRFTGDVQGLSLESISSYEHYESERDFDADQLNINVVRIVDRQQGSGISQELRLANNNDGPVAWLAGIFYHDSELIRGSQTHATVILGPDAPRLELVPGLPVGNDGDQGFFDSRSDTRHLSVFGSIDWLLTDTLSVRTGLRWQAEDKATSIINSADHTTPTAITLQLMPKFADASLSRDTTGLSWELSGSYQWSDSLVTYVLASRGFKSGGFNAGFGPTPVQLREFGDETALNFELGFKSRSLDDRWQLNATAFSTRYKNLQAAGWVSLRFLVNNAERVNARGLELDLRVNASEQLSATASLSWVGAHYDHYTNGSCHFDRPPDNADNSACDLSGRTLPLAPRTRASVSLDYEQPLRAGSLVAGLDWSWTSEYNTSSALDPRHMQGAYSIVNTRIGYRVGRIEISAWVRNAGNQLIVMQEGPSNLFPLDPAYARAFAMPRSYGLTVNARL